MSSVLTYAAERARKMSACLTTAKELKAENKELAELKIVCLLAEKQNEEINVEARERARTWRNELLKQEMAQTGLVEKVKESYLKKTLIEV